MVARWQAVVPTENLWDVTTGDYSKIGASLRKLLAVATVGDCVHVEIAYIFQSCDRHHKNR